jgi:hypothetical protein
MTELHETTISACHFMKTDGNDHIAKFERLTVQGKMVRLSLLFIFTLHWSVYSQDEPGQLGTKGIQLRDVSTYSLSSKAATLVVTSSFESITVEANGREIDISAEEAEMKMYIIPAGAFGITVRTEGFEPLMLDEFTFLKDRVYDLDVSPEYDPRNIISATGKGSLIIDSDPAGATVTIAGKGGEWTTPAVLRDLDTGSYSIMLSKTNFDTASFSITVISDSTVVCPLVPLISRIGYLSLKFIPRAHYFINNVEVFNVENKVFRMKRGQYQLDIRKSKYKNYSSVITIPSGDTCVVSAELVQDFAFIDLSQLPVNSTIFLNNAPAFRRVIETVPAYHSVRINSEVFGEVTTRFLLKPGETKILEERDFLGSGELIVSSDVPAELYINGIRDSMSAAGTSIPSGEQVIRVVSEEFGEKERTVIVKPNAKTEVFIPLLPSRSTAIMLAVVPGASQIYSGMTWKGLAYLSGFALSIAGSYYFKTEYDRQYSAYIGFVNEYNSSSDPLRIKELNGVINNSYPKVQYKQNQQYLAFGITGTIFLWNIIDIIVFEPKSGYRQKDEMISDMNITTELNANHMALGITVKF